MEHTSNRLSLSGLLDGREIDVDSTVAQVSKLGSGILHRLGLKETSQLGPASIERLLHDLRAPSVLRTILPISNGRFGVLRTDGDPVDCRCDLNAQRSFCEPPVVAVALQFDPASVDARREQKRLQRRLCRR